MFQRPWRSIWLTFVIVGALAAVTGCQSAEPEPTPSPAEAQATAEVMAEEFVASYPIAMTAWDVEYFGPPGEGFPPLPDTRATVTYFWDRYAGFDGCNWFLGVYSATDEGELRMMTPSRTAEICAPEELYEQSATFVSMLQNVTEYTIEGEQLLQDTVEDQRLLTFNPATPIPMLGTQWDLKFWWVTDREQWYPIIPTSLTTIVFSEGGEASGSAGCNDYTVGYEGDLQIEKVMEATDTYAELPTLTFGPVASQMMACEEPEGIMDQEQGFFVSLESVAYYFKLGGLVMLMDTNGEPLLILGARY